MTELGAAVVDAMMEKLDEVGNEFTGFLNAQVGLERYGLTEGCFCVVKAAKDGRCFVVGIDAGLPANGFNVARTPPTQRRFAEPKKAQ